MAKWWTGKWDENKNGGWELKIDVMKDVRIKRSKKKCVLDADWKTRLLYSQAILFDIVQQYCAAIFVRYRLANRTTVWVWEIASKVTAVIWHRRYKDERGWSGRVEQESERKTKKLLRNVCNLHTQSQHIHIIIGFIDSLFFLWFYLWRRRDSATSIRRRKRISENEKVFFFF